MSEERPSTVKVIIWAMLSLCFWVVIITLCGGVLSSDQARWEERQKLKQQNIERVNKTIADLNAKKQEKTQIIKVDERTLMIYIDGTVITVQSHSHHSAGSHLEYSVGSN